jgi:hypothetical protein
MVIILLLQKKEVYLDINYRIINLIKIGVYKEELELFLRLVVAQGHLAKLDKEYQDKFLELNKYYNEQFGGPGVYLL